MVTRITAGAFLVCKNKVLLMKRGMHKKLGPGLWAGVGGHMEMSDIKNPRGLDLAETCYREACEETGITKTDIRNLTLRYIAVRRMEDEIRFHYHFFGEVKNEIPLPTCDEGELHWVDKNNVLGLPMSTSVKEAVRHWITSPDENWIYCIAVDPAGESAVVSRL